MNRALPAVKQSAGGQHRNTALQTANQHTLGLPLLQPWRQPVGQLIGRRQMFSHQPQLGEAGCTLLEGRGLEQQTICSAH